MWLTGSPPNGDGTPPVRRIQVAQRARRVAHQRAADRLARVRRAPRVSSHITHGPTGSPASSTGTVLAHWPGAGDGDDALGRDALRAPIPASSRTMLPPGRGVLDGPAAGEPLGLVVALRDRGDLARQRDRRRP